VIARMSIWFAAILVAGGVFAGCATTSLPANATVAQKMQADAAALKQIATDVQTKCGPQFAPVAPLIASALAVAADPYSALADIMAALGAIPALAQDYKAATCVVTTIRDDIHALFGTAPAPASAPKSENDLRKAEEMGNQVLELLNQGATVTIASSADGVVEVSAYTP
jgi:hypothetical protein